MPKAISICRNGGPELLAWGATELPVPGADEVQVRHHAVGLNHIDVYYRTALYPVRILVAYAGGPLVAYSEANPEARKTSGSTVPLP